MPDDPGRTICVVGGSSGIGLALVEQLVGPATRVVACGTVPEATFRARLSSRAKLAELHYASVDITDEQAVERFFDSTVASVGPLTAAANVAGIGTGKSGIHNETLQDLRRVLRVNVEGTWSCLQHELRLMAGQRAGAIVNVASVAGLRRADSGSAAYTASKHAIVGLTRAAAVDAAADRIRVNAVCPGVVDTPMLGARRAELLAGLVARNPTARIATPAEVARVIGFLLSEDASYLSGEALVVDSGGLTGAL